MPVIVIRGTELDNALSNGYYAQYHPNKALNLLDIEKIIYRIRTHNNNFGRGELVGVVLSTDLKTGSYTVAKQYGTETRKFSLTGRRLLCRGCRSNIDKPFNVYMK